MEPQLQQLMRSLAIALRRVTVIKPAKHAIARTVQLLKVRCTSSVAYHHDQDSSRLCRCVGHQTKHPLALNQALSMIPSQDRFALETACSSLGGSNASSPT